MIIKIIPVKAPEKSSKISVTWDDLPSENIWIASSQTGVSKAKNKILPRFFMALLVKLSKVRVIKHPNKKNSIKWANFLTKWELILKLVFRLNIILFKIMVKKLLVLVDSVPFLVEL